MTKQRGPRRALIEPKQPLTVNVSSLVLTALGVLAVIGNVVVVRVDKGDWKFNNPLVWMQIGVVIVAFVAPKIEAQLAKARQRDAEMLEVAATVEARRSMTDVLEPLTLVLAEMAAATPGDRRKLLQEATRMATLCASGLISTKRARSCFFELRPGPPRELRPSKYGGRSGSPSSSFIGGTPAGDAVLELVDNDGITLCMDMSDPSSLPAGMDATKARDYQTFISVAVRSDQVGYGMLTLDHPTPGALDENDKFILRLVAKLLAVGFVMAT